ncbi:MAG: lysine--tRNA ligase [Bifidobacteriaceae bacterium]|nr:lysine--tRNA ligase [Bifidobacteriaceae bacterium]
MNSPTPTPPPRAANVSEQSQVRRDKRAAILARGDAAYPATVPVTTTIAAVRQQFGHLTAGQETTTEVGVAGRVVFIRNTGKLCFATLQDGPGNRLQAMISLAEVGQESLDRFKAEVDLGDHLFVRGRVIASKRGELSVLAAGWMIAAKALRPLPVLHSELSDESRVRDRPADLIVRPAAREIARNRVALVRSIRRTLEDRGFSEIETPILQTLHGGAAARPFTTHMNAFGIELYMRIAPELFLKRAVVGGIDKVFEIGRIFRNEGVDSSHAPEFTSVEVYEAYGDYNTIADLTQQIIVDAAQAIAGSTKVTLANGEHYDLGGEWRRVSLYDSLSEALGEEITPATSADHLRRIADAREISYDPARAGHGKLIEELFEELIGNELYEPTFVMDFPVETSPLTRDHRSKPGVVEKWDLYLRGFELATGYSELVDPVIQRQRLEAQAAAVAAGDLEAMALDEDFLSALEYGMPPSGGMGMGVDRLLMALTGLGIRETILFPLVKPQS